MNDIVCVGGSKKLATDKEVRKMLVEVVEKMKKLGYQSCSAQISATIKGGTLTVISASYF